MFLQSPLSGEKKAREFFVSRKEGHLAEREDAQISAPAQGALAERGALACAYNALGAIYALPWVYLRITRGNDASRSGRLLLIFSEFLMKRNSQKGFL